MRALLALLVVLALVPGCTFVYTSPPKAAFPDVAMQGCLQWTAKGECTEWPQLAAKANTLSNVK